MGFLLSKEVTEDFAFLLLQFLHIWLSSERPKNLELHLEQDLKLIIYFNVLILRQKDLHKELRIKTLTLLLNK